MIEKLKKHKQAWMYLFFGLGTSVVNWGIYTIAVRVLHGSSDVLIANTLSWICATTFAFITNKIWVFKSLDKRIKVVIKEAVSFFSTRLVSGAIEIVSVSLIVSLGYDQGAFGIKGMYAKLVVSLILTVVVYFISKKAIFNSNKGNNV